MNRYQKWIVLCIAFAVGVTAHTALATELKNSTNKIAIGLRVEFAGAVKITSHGREFRTQEPTSKSQEFLFADGKVRPRKTFELYWRPSSVRIVSYEWLTDIAQLKPEPRVSILASSIAGESPLQVSLEAVVEDSEDNSLGYAWTFGDGDEAEGAEVTHTYVGSGAYLVTLEVTAQSSVLPATEIGVNPCDWTNKCRS